MALSRGFLVAEAHVEMLKRLPEKTCDKVLGAAFRTALGMSNTSEIKDATGILDALVGAISAAAIRFDEENAEKRRADADRKRRGKIRCIRDLTECDGIQRNDEGENMATTYCHEKSAVDSVGFRRIPSESDGTARIPCAENGIRIERKERKNERSVYTHTGENADDDAASAPSVDALERWCEVHISPRPPVEWLVQWRQRMDEGAWRSSRGQNLLVGGAWRRELSAWWAVEKKNIAARAVESDSPAPSTGAGRVAVPMWTGAVD